MPLAVTAPPVFEPSRKIKVARLGQSGDNMQYLVTVSAQSPRIFIASVSMTCFTVKGPREEEIQRYFAHGPLPDVGAIVDLGDIGI
jgi:hypothetical protein